jgi:hypothetical protein
MNTFRQLALGAAMCALWVSGQVFADEMKLSACLHTGVTIGGVPSCGKVWKLASGQAELKHSGKLKFRVKGLVLDDASTGNANGTADGVDAVAPAVVCGDKVAAQGKPVKLSKSGNAKGSAKLKVPSDCATPVVILRERYEGKIGGWLAATGQ